MGVSVLFASRNQAANTRFRMMRFIQSHLLVAKLIVGPCILKVNLKLRPSHIDTRQTTSKSIARYQHKPKISGNRFSN